MLWETFRHSSPRTPWIDFKYRRGRSPLGLTKRLVLGKTGLARQTSFAVRASIKILLTATILGAVVGTAYPFVDLALACRAPDSEACVWGKAYLPLSLGISIPLIGGVVAVVAYAFMTWRNGRAGEK